MLGGAFLAATLLAASGSAPAESASPEDRLSKDRPRSAELRMRCEGEEFVFAGACTGTFDGVVGLALFDSRAGAWDPADDWMLEQIGLTNVTDRKANFAPRASWTALACTANSGAVLEPKGLLPGNFLFDVPMYDCRGGAGTGESFALERLHVFVTPAGARIGELEGVFTGHPENSVAEGSFRDALVSRFGEKNCSAGFAAQFCRQGARSRIEVTEVRPSRFHVRIKTPGVREEAAAHAARRIAEARKTAPVKDF